MTDADPLADLAYAAGRGDRAALTDLIRLTQRDVMRFLSPLTSPGEVEDLAQETYLRAVGALPRFAGRSSVRTWLFSIARRVAADHVRYATRRPRTAPLPDGEAPAVPARFEEHHALTELVRGLAADRREAFLLTQVAGLSYAEAAEICDCPVGTIRSRIARAREDLVIAMRVQESRNAG
ncbi:RNA polymerase sigma-70 factor (ECF subfamily) [Actinoplanes tereljensis]|uniref:RNA polymerase sigma factor n=1 Tax=Paractinoplanes tereljensis TaxID=571912 RepID=A0A919TUW9_9ACTN|nr:sigma-70 family RNA polymerase sigma factor [Actinoplanes tereljensis]GIF21800.1 RNA polymerase sigma factor [Actinoplanes tereljensis]